jgi:hypothetical protein
MIVPSCCGAPLGELEPGLFWPEGTIAVRKSRIANADDIVPSQKQSVRISHTLTGQYLAFEIDRAICHHLRICTPKSNRGNLLASGFAVEEQNLLDRAENFRFDTESNTYTCPQGKILRRQAVRDDRIGIMRHLSGHVPSTVDTVRFASSVVLE